jgi:integrase
MDYFNESELDRLLAAAKAESELHYLAILVSVMHGLRVSELINLRGHDIQDGRIIVYRLKGSNRTVQPLHPDLGRLAELAAQNPESLLFPFSRQYADQMMKRYCRKAGLHRGLAHVSALKHTCALFIWNRTQSLGGLQNYLGHKSSSSSVVYLRESDGSKAAAAIASVRV